MFDIGFWELIVIAILGLIVLGPERLPGALRALQRTVKSVREFSSNVQNELKHELRIKELHEHLQQAEQLDMDKLPPELQRSVAELKAAAQQVQRPYAPKHDDAAVTKKDDSDKHE
ncbi:Sec-independent protein translocase protein TatB [Pseudidiomarina andamanensis]|uniref:Sec-independent protein translocase protein TatB n=1 Tax=Pseudidiomarina andamanensis TaxID=1940690 RepID=A0AA92IM25_9GAMM|nr:Sec-independent protein translocase protein TatB [Pseudidiomarina andamanensis]MDS0219259.1 Sec-independent protein translocase protein TatB [Pseudidiomarina andamanensis]QGT95998.1 Sec-independent protein translocase subunit TatB [Pseudidiomarina andamanensis]